MVKIEDWNEVHPVIIDDTGDQTGNTNTDLVKVFIATDGNNISLLVEGGNEIILYHTPGIDWSHYSIGFEFYNNSNCSGNDNGFFFVQNISNGKYDDDNIGDFHFLEGFFIDDTLKGENNIEAAISGHSMELSFSADLIP